MAEQNAEYNRAVGKAMAEGKELSFGEWQQQIRDRQDAKSAAPLPTH
jgi:hypothetical protein